MKKLTLILLLISVATIFYSSQVFSQDEEFDAAGPLQGKFIHDGTSRVIVTRISPKGAYCESWSVIQNSDLSLVEIFSFRGNKVIDYTIEKHDAFSVSLSRNGIYFVKVGNQVNVILLTNGDKLRLAFF